MAERIPTWGFKGIPKICIPKRDSDFIGGDYGKSIIKRYLPYILAEHQKNADKEEDLYNYFLGKQDIITKQRRYKSDWNNNNIITENHANKIVEFKVGILTSEKRDYTHKAESNSDDLIYLDRYFTQMNFFAKNKQVLRWVYATGIGTTYTSPRTDIIIDDGIDKLTNLKRRRYKTKEEGFNIDFDSPISHNFVNPQTNFNVYSSSFDNEPLFSVSIVDIEEKDSLTGIIVNKQIQIETRYAVFIVYSNNGYSVFPWDDYDNTDPIIKSLHYLPIIEYSVNDDRMGVIETIRETLNSINTFRSAIADMTLDNANALLVFKNVDVKSDEIKEMKKAGAIIISDANNARTGGTADLKTITLEIPYDKLTTYIDQVQENMYGLVGVPLPNGNVTSGGDTGQARSLGNGWDNCYIMTNNEKTTLLAYDYQQLELFLYLCRQVPNCKLNELYATQIDINYHINQSDNMLVKFQSMKYMFDMGMPFELILKYGKVSNDIKTDKRLWEEWYNKIQQQNEEIKQLDNNPQGSL